MVVQDGVVPERAAPPRGTQITHAPAAENTNRIAIFWLQIFYLAVLAVVAWLHFADGIPTFLRFPPMFGPIPAPVLWYGALGGILISLAGIHDHRYDWESSYWTWHVARPLVGAAVSIIAVLIIQAGILALGVDLTSNAGSASNQTTTGIFYYLVAFMAGYREETFRGMVKRLGDVILTSEATGPAPMIRAVVPNSAAAAGGLTVSIQGSGFAGAQSVHFGTVASPTIKVVSDAEIQAKVPAGTAGDKVAVSVVTAKGSTSTTDAFTYN